MPQTALEETETNEAVIDTPQKEEPVEKKEETSEFEIEIQDDTPEEDQNREPMPEEIKETIEKDELNEYTKEKGKQLKKIYHDERRAKEQAIRERDHATKLAKQALEENKRLMANLNQGEQMLMSNSKSSAEHELALAKKTYKEAYDAGDADLIAEASDKLATARVNLSKAEEYQPQYSEEALQTHEDTVNSREESIQNQPVAPAPVDERYENWTKENDWWQNDDIMTAMAYGKHLSLIKEGVTPSDKPDEYYAAIDKEMRQRFPEYFKETEEVASSNRSAEQSQKTVVSPAKRSTNSKKVVLTKSELAVAKRLGITPEDMAREKLKLYGG